MRRLYVSDGSSPRRRVPELVSDLHLYEASGSDRTDGFGSIGSARASLAFEMPYGSDNESEASFDIEADLGSDLDTSTASFTTDTEDKDKIERRASKSGGSSAGAANRKWSLKAHSPIILILTLLIRPLFCFSTFVLFSLFFSFSMAVS